MDTSTNDDPMREPHAKYIAMLQNPCIWTVSDFIKSKTYVFPQKLYYITSFIPNNESGIRFHKNGGIIITNYSIFKKILPIFFKTNRMVSFKRNLAIYQFKSILPNQYRHSWFKPHNFSQITKMKRKIKSDSSTQHALQCKLPVKDSTTHLQENFMQDSNENLINTLYEESNDTFNEDSNSIDTLSKESLDTFNEDSIDIHLPGTHDSQSELYTGWICPTYNKHSYNTSNMERELFEKFNQSKLEDINTHEFKDYSLSPISANNEPYHWLNQETGYHGTDNDKNILMFVDICKQT